MFTTISFLHVSTTIDQKNHEATIDKQTDRQTETDRQRQTDRERERGEKRGKDPNSSSRGGRSNAVRGKKSFDRAQ